jgi:hypothetical protein
MRNYFLKNINIQGKGGIVAAPDYDTPGGSYYYHWMRDGALTMRCFQETNPSGNFSDIENTVKSYIGWVLHNQNEADPNGIDVRTEPKFELPNGEVFSAAWCRPQNDGPGLRATTLMIAANSLIAKGESQYVKDNLWTGNSGVYHGGAIKYDLDYIVSSYNSNTCDLWEEIRDPDFFWNRITMKKAMIMGNALLFSISHFSLNSMLCALCSVLCVFLSTCFQVLILRSQWVIVLQLQHMLAWHRRLIQLYTLLIGMELLFKNAQLEHKMLPSLLDLMMVMMIVIICLHQLHLKLPALFLLIIPCFVMNIRLMLLILVLVFLVSYMEDIKEV